MSDTIVFNQSSDDSMDHTLVIDESINSDKSQEMDSSNHVHDLSIFHSITDNLINDTNDDIVIGNIVQNLIDTIVTLEMDTATITNPINDPQCSYVINDNIIFSHVVCSDDSDSDLSITVTNNDSLNNDNSNIIEKSMNKDHIIKSASDPNKFLAPSLVRLTKREIERWTKPVTKQGIKRSFALKIKMNDPKKRKYQPSADRPKWKCNLCVDRTYVGINSHVSRHVRTVHKSHEKFLLAYNKEREEFFNTSLVMSKIDKNE